MAIVTGEEIEEIGRGGGGGVGARCFTGLQEADEERREIRGFGGAGGRLPAQELVAPDEQLLADVVIHVERGGAGKRVGQWKPRT